MLLVRSGRHGFQLGLDNLFHFPDPTQVGVNVVLFLAVENLLSVQVHFKAAIRAGGERDRHIATKSPEELVRHPRGGRVMLSRDTVHDVYEGFPFTGHHYPPSYELSEFFSESAWLEAR